MDAISFECAIREAVDASPHDGTKWDSLEEVFADAGLRGSASLNNNSKSDLTTRIRQLATAKIHKGCTTRGVANHSVLVIAGDLASLDKEPDRYYQRVHDALVEQHSSASTCLIVVVRGSALEFPRVFVVEGSIATVPLQQLVEWAAARAVGIRSVGNPPTLTGSLQVPCRNQVYSERAVYTLEGKLGDGAVGVVRKATSHDGRAVAIKFLAPDPKYIETAAFDDVAERFSREGIRGSRLNHRGLVKILAYSDNAGGVCFDGATPANPFLVMDRVKGRTLESEIRATEESRSGVFDITRDRLFIAVQLAHAIRYLHNKKMVHRDVKPANIFIERGELRHGLPRVRLGDFGIVKWGDFHKSLATGTLTTTHQQGLGTLKYMSPEQAIRPRDVTVKSDIFSLGVTLYELFTGAILGSPHHVFQIMTARLGRGGTGARFLELGHEIMGMEPICETLLDCFLRGAKGRPKITDFCGRLSRLYSDSFDTEWQDDMC